MIRSGVIWAIHQSATLFVALAAQVVALVFVGDVLVSAPRAEATPSRSDVTLARVAPFARGERLMMADLAVDLAPTTSASITQTGPTADILEATAEPALAPAAEVTTPEPPMVVESTPEPTPKPTPAPTQRPAPAAPVITTSPATHEAELRMLGLMNLSRVNAGLAPLALDVGVSDAARRHSAVEAQYRYVYHDGPDGTAKSRYVPACGTGWYGENTGKVWGGGVDVLHREFMAEPWEPINHRTNIMDPNFRRAGIGAVQGPDAIYITVAFCR